jgi:hypothetical protein
MHDILIRECQWVGDQDPRLGNLHYCGRRDLWPGKAYCAEHVWKVYQKHSSVGNKRRDKAIEKEMAEVKRLEDMDNE